MAEVEIGREAIEREGDFDRVQVFPLDVLDERDFEEMLVGNVLDYGGQLREAREFRRAPATLAGDELITVAMRPDNQRLDDAVCGDGIGKLLEPRRIEYYAGL
jgi:hypothetical protein